MFNIGTDVSFWLGLAQVIITILLIAKIGFTVRDYIKGGLEKKENWQKYEKLLTYVIISVIILVIMFFGYGKGEVELQSEGDPIGLVEMQEEAPDENIDSVRKVTEESVPHSLKRQKDKGFAEEQAEAEKYLKSLNQEAK